MRYTTLAIFLAAALTSPVAAKESVAVQFDDLDLTQPAGVATLEKRLNLAVARVCWDAVPSSLLFPGAMSACKEATRAKAYEQVAEKLPGVSIKLALR